MKELGAIIKNGPVDWQIIQQEDGKADIHLSGYWVGNEEGIDYKVYVRIVKEDSSIVVVPWTESCCYGENQWNSIVRNVPVGGLYRIETCLKESTRKDIEWSIRGDMIHHIGIGDVYVIAGQSNSAGYGKDPIYDPPELGIHLLKNSGKWDIASHPMNESTNSCHIENRENCNPGHSPYLSFAKQIKRETGYPIGLVQTSLGGSYLSAWNPQEDGVLYKNMMNIIMAQGGKIKGILWYQGCSDTEEGLCDTYLDRFKSLVENIRIDLKDDKLPIFTVQLNRKVTSATTESNMGWAKVREAQRQAHKEILGVYVIPTIDSNLSDAIHISSSSNMVIGERIAAIVLKYVYGKQYHYEAPDINEAKRMDSNKILLTFDNVYDRLYTYEVDAIQLPFTVEDEKGFLKIVNYEQNRPDTLLITLDRDIELGVKVHGAYEQNPKAIIPIDSESHIPMLAFYGVDVK